MSNKTSHQAGTVNTEKDTTVIAPKRPQSTTGQGMTKGTQKRRVGNTATQRRKSFVL